MKRGKLGWKWLAVGFAGCLVVASFVGWRMMRAIRLSSGPDPAVAAKVHRSWPSTRWATLLPQLTEEPPAPKE